MRKQLKTIVGAAVLTTGLLAAPVLYASGDMPVMGGGSMMGQGSANMMGGQGGMMGMMGMMNMMGQMDQMAQNCNTMMTSMMTNHATVPNRQGQQDTPQAAPSHHDQSK